MRRAGGRAVEKEMEINRIGIGVILLLLTVYGSVQAGFHPVDSVGGQLAKALLGNSEKMFLPGAFYIETGQSSPPRICWQRASVCWPPLAPTWTGRRVRRRMWRMRLPSR